MAKKSNWYGNEQRTARLRNAIDACFADLSHFRRKRNELTNLWVTTHYTGGSERRQPVGMIGQTLRIYSRALAGRTPKAFVSTPHQGDFLVQSHELQIAASHVYKECDLGRSFQDCVKNALTSVGAMKIGVTYDRQGRMIPFASALDFDDIGWDTTARSIATGSFAFDAWEIPKDKALESGLFEKAQIEKLVPHAGEDDGSGDDEREYDQIGRGSRSFAGDVRNYRDMIELWDVWLPDEGDNGMLLTISRDGDSNKVLRAIEWDGHPKGPYAWLQFETVPKKTMPLPMLYSLIDINETLNSAHRKLGRQTTRQKTVLFAGPGADKDARKVVKSGDGDVIRVDQPDQLKEARFGGPDQPTIGWAMVLKQIASGLAGNLDLVGGTAAQAATLGQEELLQQNNAGQLDDLVQTTREFQDDVCSRIAWYLWHSPDIEIDLEKKLGYADVTIPFRWTQNRVGEFSDYNVQISAAPLTPRTPAGQIKKLLLVLTQVYPLAAQALAAQGIQLDGEQLVAVLADYLDADELHRIFSSGSVEAAAGPEPDVADPGARHYVHESKSRKTKDGQEQVMARGMFGQNSQESESAI